MVERDYATLWVCIDCRDAEASGEPQDVPTWTAIHPDDMWKLITPGLMAEEHAEECPNFDEDGNYIGMDDEFCEDQDFSWARCHGCGSTLGGSRHAYTMHL